MASSKKLRTGVVLGSIVLHLGVGIGVFASGVWSIERLGGDFRAPSIAVVLPPEPAPAGGVAKLPETKIEQKIKEKKVVKELTQLAEKKIETPAKPTVSSHEPGEGSGEGPGKGSGSAGDKGECLIDCGPGTPKPPQKVELPKDEPTMVPPNVLTMNWLTGTKQIHPTEGTKMQMMRDGNSKTTGVVQVCVNESGRVSSASMLRSTKYPAYDALLLSTIRDWTYKPFSAKGKNVKVCGVTTFVYSIR